MKIKLIVMITLLIHLVCMSVAWAESEDLSKCAVKPRPLGLGI